MPNSLRRPAERRNDSMVYMILAVETSRSLNRFNIKFATNSNDETN
jgi:hypothetical protein